MLFKNQVRIPTNLVCDRICLDLHKTDFLYYDKDGFELNSAEQKYYSLMRYGLKDCLNHRAYVETWYTSQNPKLIIDHSLILYRCSYQGDARRQLDTLKTCVPQASLLLRSEAKWGFDFALDSIDSNGNVFEVIHIEYDNKNLDAFTTELNTVQERIDQIDWLDAANTILKERDKWQSLQGFAQNDWKARRLLGWRRAESTEKTI